MDEGDHPRGTTQGNRSLDVERKACEKPGFPVSICEDCTESWLVVRAKALYNLYVFPPCMIIQIVAFLAEDFPKVFSCLLCDLLFFFWLYLFSLIFKFPQIDSRSRL